MSSPNLIAIKVERRTVAVAIFIGGHLDFTEIRQLSSNPDKAEASAMGFISWVFTAFQSQSAALERLAPKSTIRRAHISQAILRTLREQGVSVWDVAKQELFEAYGIPALKTRKELREVISSFWPILNGGERSEAVLDAAALGLYVQTERVFGQ